MNFRKEQPKELVTWISDATTFLEDGVEPIYISSTKFSTIVTHHLRHIS
jgi:hypothetical protein